MDATNNAPAIGQLIEYAPTEQLFQGPREQRAEQDISGRLG